MHAILDFIMYTWIQSHSGYALINLWEGVVLFSITQYNVAVAFFFFPHWFQEFKMPYTHKSITMFLFTIDR